MAAATQPKPEVPGIDPWTRVEGLPCLLSIEIPVPNFTVADLVRLAPSRLVDSRWIVGEDVPLLINGELIAWSEFEILNNHVAVRLTELA
ncbi:MAG: FliM/FliN family flagellar motor C-terminal domain-containing protein [Terriglobales bacterium]|jgi:flagellar motor switch protein FliN/FliY